MMAVVVRLISFLVWVCLTTAAPNPQSDLECLQPIQALIRESFERTCTQDLLQQVKESVDNITEILTMYKLAEQTPQTCGEITQRKQLVSALTGTCENNVIHCQLQIQ